MSTKQMIFNTEMVRALLSGQKTATRRVVKPQPPSKTHPNLFVMPPYQRSDILYVREAWRPTGEIVHPYAYAADESTLRLAGENGDIMEFRYRWKPSIHMPKEAARIFLRVTDVRVERLQSIKKEGVVKEGVAPKRSSKGCKCTFAVDGCLEKPCANRDAYEEMCYIEPFAKIWDSAIKPSDRVVYGWDANPWVWVIEFERISREEVLK